MKKGPDMCDDEKPPLQELSIDLVMKNIFTSCDIHSSDHVHVYDLIQFIEPFMKNNLSELMELQYALDPESINPSISSDVFYKTMNEWVLKLNESSVDICNNSFTELNSSNFNKSDIDSVFQQSFCNNNGIENESMQSLNVSLYTTTVDKTVNLESMYNEEEINNLIYQNDKLRDELKRIKDCLIIIEEEKDNLSADYDRMYKRLKSEQKINEHLQKERNKIEALKKASAAFKHIKEETKEIETLRETSSTAFKQIEELRVQFNNCKKENLELKVKLSSAEVEKQNYEEKCAHYKSANMSVQKTINELEKKIEMSNNEIRCLERSNEVLVEKYNEQQQICEHYKNINLRIKEEKEYAEHLLEQHISEKDIFINFKSNNCDIQQKNYAVDERHEEDNFYFNLMLHDSEKYSEHESLQSEILKVENKIQQNHNGYEPNSSGITECVKMGDQQDNIYIQQQTKYSHTFQYDHTNYHNTIRSLNEEMGKLKSESSSNKDREIILFEIKRDLEKKLQNSKCFLHEAAVKLLELDELDNKCKALETENDNLKEENAKKYMIIVDLAEQTEKLRTKLHEVYFEHSEELNLLQNKLNKMGDDKNDPIVDIENLKAEKDNVLRYETPITQLKVQNFGMKQSVNALCEECGGILKLEMENKDTKIVSDEKHLTDKQEAKCAIVRSKYETVSEESLKSYEKKIYNLEVENCDLMQKIEAGKANITELNNKIITQNDRQLVIEKELQSLQSQNVKFSDENLQLQKIVEETVRIKEAEIVLKNNECEKLFNDLEKQKDIIYNLQQNFYTKAEEVEMKNRVIEQLQSDLDTKIETNSNLSNELNKKDVECNNISKEMNCLKNQTIKLKEELITCNADMDKLMFLNSRIKNELDNKIKECESLSNKLITANTKYESVFRELECFKQEKDRLKNFNNNLSSEIKSIKTTNISLQKNNTDLKLALANVSQEKLDLSNEYEKLETRLKEKELLISEVHNKLISAKFNVTHLEENCDVLKNELKKMHLTYKKINVLENINNDYFKQIESNDAAYNEISNKFKKLAQEKEILFAEKANWEELKKIFPNERISMLEAVKVNELTKKENFDFDICANCEILKKKMIKLLSFNEELNVQLESIVVTNNPYFQDIIKEKNNLDEKLENFVEDRVTTKESGDFSVDCKMQIQHSTQKIEKLKSKLKENKSTVLDLLNHIDSVKEKLTKHRERLERSTLSIVNCWHVIIQKQNKNLPDLFSKNQSVKSKWSINQPLYDKVCKIGHQVHLTSALLDSLYKINVNCAEFPEIKISHNEAHKRIKKIPLSKFTVQSSKSIISKNEGITNKPLHFNIFDKGDASRFIYVTSNDTNGDVPQYKSVKEYVMLNGTRFTPKPSLINQLAYKRDFLEESNNDTGKSKNIGSVKLSARFLSFFFVGIFALSIIYVGYSNNRMKSLNSCPLSWATWEELFSPFLKRAVNVPQPF